MGSYNKDHLFLLYLPSFLLLHTTTIQLPMCINTALTLTAKCLLLLLLFLFTVEGAGTERH